MAGLCLILFGMSQAGQFILFPMFADSLQLPLADIILAYGCGSLSFLFGAPFWSGQNRNQGAKRVLLYGLLGLLLPALTLVYFLHIDSGMPWLLLLLSRIFYGLMASALVPTAQIAFAHASDCVQTRYQSFFKYGIYLNIGRLLGPIILWATLAISESSYFELIAILSLAVIILVISLPFEIQSSRLNAPVQRISKSTILVATLAFLITGVAGVIHASLGALIQSRLSMPSIEVSRSLAFLVIIASVTLLIVQALALRRLKNPLRGPMPSALFVLTASVLCLIMASRLFEFIIAIVCLASAMAILTPTYTTILSRYFCQDQSTCAASLAIAHTLGYGFGTICSGIVLGLGDIAPLVFCLVLIFCAFTVARFIEIRATYHEGDTLVSQRH